MPSPQAGKPGRAQKSVKDSLSVFSASAPSFLENGYSPVPRIVQDGRGRPAVRGWSDLCERQATEHELKQWAAIPDADVALACGFGGFVAIDVDTDDVEILAAVVAALPHCIVARRGSKGFALLCRYADGPQPTLNVYRADEARKDPLVEIMGLGRVIAIPPSIHAKTSAPYIWIDPAKGKLRLAGWQIPALADLPLVSAADVEKLIAALKPWSRKPRPPRLKAEGPAPVLTSDTEKRYRAYALGGLERAAASLSSLQDGRPSELFRAVCGLGWAVRHRVLSEIELTNAFAAACETNGLAARDGRRAIEATIRSGLRWAEHDPLPDLGDRPRDHEPGPEAPGNGGGDRGDGAENTGAASSDPGQDPGQWPDPLPLTSDEEPEPYPLDALPEGIRAAVTEVHTYAQTPLAMVAMSSLAALSLAAQGLVDVRRDAMLCGPVSLFILLIGESGERKTTIDKFFTKPLHDFERRKAEELEPEIKAALARHAAWEAKKRGKEEAIKNELKKGRETTALENDLEVIAKGEPSIPRLPVLIRQDDTVEELAYALSRKYPSAGIVSSEAGLVLGGHAMAKDNVVKGLAQKNVFWDGGTIRFGRRTSESFVVRGARLTIYLQAQAATVRAFTKQSGDLARGVGFWARCLIAWPESTQGRRSYKEPLACSPALDAFSRRISALLEVPLSLDDNGVLEPAVLTLGSDGKSLWIELYNGIEAELLPGGDCETIKDVASKAAENIARLAALFHVFEHGPEGEIDADAVRRAGEIVIWHLGEARRFFNVIDMPQERLDAIALDQWLRKRGGATSREILRDGPHGLRDGAWQKALEKLVATFRARRVDSKRGFRVEINPALLGGGHVS